MGSMLPMWLFESTKETNKIFAPSASAKKLMMMIMRSRIVRILILVYNVWPTVESGKRASLCARYQHLRSLLSLWYERNMVFRLPHRLKSSDNGATRGQVSLTCVTLGQFFDVWLLFVAVADYLSRCASNRFLPLIGRHLALLHFFPLYTTRYGSKISRSAINVWFCQLTSDAICRIKFAFTFVILVYLLTRVS